MGKRDTIVLKERTTVSEGRPVETAYVWLMLVAAGAGGLVAAGSAMQVGVSFERIRRVIASVLVGSALGARLGAVVAAGGTWAVFARPDSVPGSMQGALVGGLLAWWVSAERAERWRVADALALGATVALGVGWYAMLVHPVVYGVVWNGGMVLPDLAGVRLPRIPVALIGSIWYALAALGVWGLWRLQTRPGFVTWGWLIAFGMQQVVLGFWRGDATVWLGAWRLGQVLGGIEIVVASMVMAVWRWRQEEA